MGLAVFGIVLVVVSVVLWRFHFETGDRINLRPWAWAARALGVMLIVVGVLSAMIVIVPAGHRGVLMLFGAVRPGPMKEGFHLIIPYVNTADYVISSAMPYELSLWRTRLLDQFTEWAAKYRDDPLRQDAAIRAERVRRLLESVVAAPDESAIPSTSVMREFIGGSSYRY